MYIQDKKKFIKNIAFFLIVAIILIVGFSIFEKNNYNDYSKAEYYLNKTKFTRDGKNKYSKSSSYKIYSQENNDAMFYKKIKVQKNKVYKITCMAKTEDVKTKEDSSGAGAQISVVDTTEKSKSLKGTTDWKQLELLIDSKDREEIEVGFRLGGYDDNCTGTAWFSDFKIEIGTQETSSKWNFALFICEKIDADIEKDGTKQNVKIDMSKEDVDIMVDDISRFQNSIKTLSGNKMTAEIKIYDVKEPITTLSYDEENGYFISAKDVENLIDEEVSKNEFDHIFIAVRFGDMLKKTEIPVNDWIGLGYMDYYGIGFSNIRLPNSTGSYMYRYDAGMNIFPEEVFVHEFLHSLERELNERNYKIPELHSYRQYGYTVKSNEGLKTWYQDYMQKKVKTSAENVGLDSDVYTIKPVKESCFENATKLDYFEEPKTIFGEIGKLISTIGK